VHLVRIWFSWVQKAYRRVIYFYLSYDKPCGKRAVLDGIVSRLSVHDKSNSVAMVSRIQTGIEIICHVGATFSLKYRNK